MKHRDPRRNCEGQIRVATPRGEFHALPSNISASGIRVAGLIDVSPGDQIRISIVGRRHLATVVWTRMGAFGAKFGTRLTEQQIALFTNGRTRKMVEIRSPIASKSFHGFRELR